MSLVIHPKTKAAVDVFLAHPVHAIALTGDLGIGKTALALELSAALLGILPEKAAEYPSVKQIHPNEKGSVLIESIHEINDFLRLKTFGDRTIKRVVIINSAHGMTLDAQNALLKVLEEPPADTVIILCADQPDALLPTIRSRCQIIAVMRPTEAQLLEHFKPKAKSEANLAQSIAISDQLPGLLSAMLDEEDSHPLVNAIALAKSFLADSRYGRLALVNAVAKDKETVALLLLALQRIAQAALTQSVRSDKPEASEHWHRRLECIATAITALRHNPSIKLLLTDLSLEL